ncbi:SRPBCC domain-containing protein [Stagnihabitans tardus]|uniref:Polyketide cyclase n=1 Tax=Stagnihabitans tardus TaxID=2699202 RepID=A0AAE4YC68_9RHOB|nr:SRPBCC domain-containing protein [Stagnihabitans tardus]NBZ89863.1 polyketide cyclase [Stagnihabitans tardus]
MRDLSVERRIAAPRDLVWRCLTEGQHLARWWVPAPVTVEDMVLEPQPGGRFGYVMILEDGARFALDMMICEARGHRLIFTDLMSGGFQPMAAPMFGFVGELALTEVEGGTLYRATARHAREEDARRHDEMGFHDGWGAVAGQLVTYAEGLR